MLGISFQVGGGYIIPMYHHHSTWDWGKDDQVSIEETENGVALFKNGEPIKKYNGELVLRSEDSELFDIIHEAIISNIQFAKEQGYTNLLQEYVFNHLKVLFANRDIRKIAQNFKFDYKVARKMGIELLGRFDDTLIMHHSIREGRPHGLKEMAAEYFPEFDGYEEGIDYASGSLRDLGIYCATDNDLTLRLAYILELEMMKDSRVYAVYRNLETTKLEMLGDMEYEGMQVDLEALNANLKKVRELKADRKEFLLSHPVLRRFMAYEATGEREKLINETEEKLIALVDKSVKALHSKTDSIKQGTKAYDKHLARIKLVENGNYAHKDYPYKQAVKYYDDLVRLKAGEGQKTLSMDFTSSKQLGHFIYTSAAGLGYNMPVTVKTKKDPVSGRKIKVREKNADTSKDILLMLDDDSGIISAVLEYRTLQSLESTFLQGMSDLLDSENKIHSSFSTVKTQRLSSSNPNLQNIITRTKYDSVKEVVGGIKRMFIAPSGDYSFFQADLSQAELRWAAWLWNVSSMKKAFEDGIDLHILASCSTNGMTLDQYYALKEKDPDRAGRIRYEGKANNFGFIFGAGPETYMEYAKKNYGLEISLDQAKKHHHAYLNVLHPDIPRAHRDSIKKARKFAYVRTAFGSKRHTPNIHDQNPSYRSADERVAINTRVQGSSGQGLLFSLIIFRLRLNMLALNGGIINSVHDSALGFVLNADRVNFLNHLKLAMNNPPTKPYFGFDFAEIRMKTDIEIGENWKDLKKFEL